MFNHTPQRVGKHLPPVHPPTWCVEGGQECDVAVANANGVLDKQVGETVGKPPAQVSGWKGGWVGGWKG